MTISLKHKFQSQKGDGLDSSQVQPSNWNDDHELTLSSGKVVGRSTAGNGNAEELPAGAFGLSLLATATITDLQALLGVFSTGDAKLTFKNVADTGWILLNDGTIGKGGTSATTRANDDTKDLYVLIWNNVPDGYAPVTGGRGTNGALADFNAGKVMAMPKALGRALIIAGTGLGLTNRVLGSTFGEESHVLSAAEIPAHTHPAVVNDPMHSHTTNASIPSGTGANNPGGISPSSGGAVINPSATGITVTINPNTGGGSAHNNTPAAIGINIMVRL